MELAKVVGPGFDSWFLERLRLQEIDSLTKVQQLAVADGVCERASMVVCAPTSSGKTLVGELALLAAVRDGAKVLYLVSHKALADQKYDDFQERYGEAGRDPIARIALATGDRDDGDPDANVLVTTYEKAIALVMSGALDSTSVTIVADELQILGEDKRGPEIEVLCAGIRQRGPRQFVALTATVSNGEDLAGWLNCKLVHTSHRDVDLIQEIWADNKIYSVKFGQEGGQTAASQVPLPRTTLEAVDKLRKDGRGPILVFTETRRDAMKLAADYSARRSKTAKGYKFSEQLDLFSEATEFSARLKSSTETNVAFHTADLTASERAVVEQGLIDGHFDVCFATPTLAAGVNFPFRTVLFDRVRRKYIPPADMPLGTYRNMSGRAGRLGMHDQGFSVIIPRDNLELRHANKLIGPDNEPLVSKLASLSVRKIVLQLISCESATDAASTKDFLQNTLFWYQVQDRNPVKLEGLIIKIDEAIAWLITAEMIEYREEKLCATKFGKVVAQTGLLPSSAAHFAKILSSNADGLDSDFDAYEVGLLLAVCASDEFDSEIGQRFLPYAAKDVSSDNSYELLAQSKRMQLVTGALERNIAHCVYALHLFICGEAERRISAFSGIPSGQLHRFSQEIAWMLRGIKHIAAVPSLAVSQKVMNQVAIFTRRVELGVPMELVDLLDVAQKAKVPGFGRQRALALRKAGFSAPEQIVSADFAALEKVLANTERTKRLLTAIEQSENDPVKRAYKLHSKFANGLGLGQLIGDLYEKIGNDYEVPVEKILRLETAWEVIKLDDGVRQGVPDFMISLNGRSAVLECKTTVKKPPMINKEEAFAVQHKATDIENVHKITLGKPAFDTFSESKACGSVEITLLRHSDFVEAMLLLRSGSVNAAKVFEWMVEPGVAELERLGRLPTT